MSLLLDSLLLFRKPPPPLFSPFRLYAPLSDISKLSLIRQRCHHKSITLSNRKHPSFPLFIISACLSFISRLLGSSRHKAVSILVPKYDRKKQK